MPVTGPSSPLTVTGLVNGQSYRFKVRARNEAGWGQFSALSDTVTPVAAPVAVGSLIYTANYDTGDFSQWSGVQAPADRQPTIIADPDNASNPVGRFELQANDSVTIGGVAGHRSEVLKSSSAVPSPIKFYEGDERAFYLRVRLGSMFAGGWGNGNQHLKQWKQDDSGSPPIDMRVLEDGRLALTDRRSFNYDTGLKIYWAIPRPLDLEGVSVWHNFVIVIKFSADPAVGWIEVHHSTGAHAPVRQMMLAPRANGGFTRSRDGMRVFTNTAAGGTGMGHYLKEGYYSGSDFGFAGVVLHDGAKVATSVAALSVSVQEPSPPPAVKQSRTARLEPAGTSIAPALPETRTAGRVLLSALSVDKSAGTLTAPTGYTTLTSPASFVGPSVSGALYGRLADNTTADNPTWSWTTGNTAAAFVAELNLSGYALGIGTLQADDTIVSSRTIDLGAAPEAGLLVAAYGIDTYTGTGEKTEASFDGTGWFKIEAAKVVTGGTGVTVMAKYVQAGDSRLVTGRWGTRSDQAWMAVVQLNKTALLLTESSPALQESTPLLTETGVK